MTTPIRAKIINDDRCEAEGYTVRGYSPVLAMCRKLVVAGYNPATPLHVYRGDVLALKVRSIGEGAQRTVEDNKTGMPTFRRWRNNQARGGRGSPIRRAA